MAKTVKTYAALFSAINTTAASALNELATKVEELWYEYLDVGFYQAYEPSVYEREYAILKALVKTEPVIVGNKVTVEVYIDNDIMNKYHPNTYGEWDGATTAKMVESVGFTLKNGIHRDPAYAYESAVQYLRTDFEKFLKSRLG